MISTVSNQGTVRFMVYEERFTKGIKPAFVMRAGFLSLPTIRRFFIRKRQIINEDDTMKKESLQGVFLAILICLIYGATLHPYQQGGVYKHR